MYCPGPVSAQPISNGDTHSVKATRLGGQTIDYFYRNHTSPSYMCENMRTIQDMTRSRSCIWSLLTRYRIVKLTATLPKLAACVLSQVVRPALHVRRPEVFLCFANSLQVAARFPNPIDPPPSGPSYLTGFLLSGPASYGFGAIVLILRIRS